MVLPEGGCWPMNRAGSGSLLSRPQEAVFLSGSWGAGLGPGRAAGPSLSPGGRAPAVALPSEGLLFPLQSQKCRGSCHTGSQRAGPVWFAKQNGDGGFGAGEGTPSLPYLRSHQLEGIGWRSEAPEIWQSCEPWQSKDPGGLP